MPLGDTSKHRITVTLVGVAVMLFMICPSCRKEKTDTLPNFADRKAVPVMYVDSVTTLISDSGRIRYKVLAETWEYFDQADEPYWYFPQGVYFERFDDSMRVESMVRGDTARYFTKLELWKLQNHVLVKNMTGEQFETNLLFWSQQQRRVYSDSFIRIQQADQILMGYGFESNERMSKYKIFEIKGVFPLDTEEEALNNPE